MAKLTPPDWVTAVEKALVVLWDAVDAADLAIIKALRDQEPVNGDLERFSAEFGAAKNKLIGVLLDALSPDEECAPMPDAARAVS